MISQETIIAEEDLAKDHKPPPPPPNICIDLTMEEDEPCDPTPILMDTPIVTPEASVEEVVEMDPPKPDRPLWDDEVGMWLGTGDCTSTEEFEDSSDLPFLDDDIASADTDESYESYKLRLELEDLKKGK